MTSVCSICSMEDYPGDLAAVPRLFQTLDFYARHSRSILVCALGGKPPILGTKHRVNDALF